MSPATAGRVAAAIGRLGFERDPGAADLARGRSLRLGVVVPAGGNPFMRLLAEEARRAAPFFRLRRVHVAIVEADIFSPRLLAASLAALHGRFDGIALVGFDHPLVRDAVDGLVEAGTAVTTLVSDVPGSRRLRYVGIDNRAAGRVAASLVGRFAGPGSAEAPKRVAAVLGSLGLSDHLERLAGFREVLEARFPGVRLAATVEGRDDEAMTRDAVAALLKSEPELCALYNAGAANDGVAAALAASGAGRAGRVVFVGHELTAETRPLLQSGVLDALIVQSPGHEARSALRLLVAALGGGPVVEDQERIRIEIVLADNLPDE